MCAGVRSKCSQNKLCSKVSDGIDIHAMKRLAWEEAKRNLFTINVAKTNIGWRHNEPETPYIINKLLVEVRRLNNRTLTSVNQDIANAETERLEAKYVPPPEVMHDFKERYRAAHKINFAREFPAAFKDGFYSQPVLPKVNTSNGLTTYIINFIMWHGYRATRVNVSGRLIETPEKQASGVILGTKKYMRSSTRKGSADISSTVPINGVGASVMWEVKIGSDRPSANQLREQAREERAGGRYYFIKTVNDFLTIFDSLLYG